MPLDTVPNAFAGGRLDRASHRRRDGGWLAERLGDDGTRLLLLRDGDPWATDGPEGPRLALAPLGLQSGLATDDERLLFLGVDDGRAVFALDLTGRNEAADYSTAEGRFAGLRHLAPALDGAELALAGTARAVFEWRGRNGFCARCGSPTRVVDAGWKRLCPACGAEHFPRVDPVVIMLPVRDERCVLGRQAAWPPGRYSALAGFVEPGESVDEACAREVREECGLEVERVRVDSTQPWPFPHSLMIGLIAEVGPGEPYAADGELEAVRWMDRAQARALAAGETVDGVTSPPPFAIAHRLLQAWAAG